MAGFTLLPGALKNPHANPAKPLHPTPQHPPPDLSRFKKISPLTASRLSTVLCSFYHPTLLSFKHHSLTIHPMKSP
jgi:hypothetical protein